MALERKVVPPEGKGKKNKIQNRTSLPVASEKLTVSFSKFQISSVSLKKKFNNFFKDEEHYIRVSSDFIGKILPKITSHTFNEICEGSWEGQTLHFHSIDDKHRKAIREVLEEYNFPQKDIDQMLEGNSIFECSAILGHAYPARVVCHKIDNVLEFLFFDTNHHIYMNEKFLGETLFYEECPIYQYGKCTYMPAECFAVGYLDETKLRKSYGFDLDISQ